jgi:hypothetical protein
MLKQTNTLDRQTPASIPESSTRTLGGGIEGAGLKVPGLKVPDTFNASTRTLGGDIEGAGLKVPDTFNAFNGASMPSMGTS